jgi:hypothetical protein
MSQENDAPTGSGFAKSTKVLCTTADASPAAADFVRLDQRIEGQNLQQVKKGTAAAEQLTLSFWVKSNVTGTYAVRLYDNDNTRQTAKTYTINASATWEYKTITFSADTTGAFDNDNAASLILMFMLGAGTDYTSGTLQTTWSSYTAANSAVGQVNLASATNNYWQITGVQLEVGATATPFEFKPYAQDLAECQRYFLNVAAGELSGNFANTTQCYLFMELPVHMRVSPTATYPAGPYTNEIDNVLWAGRTPTSFTSYGYTNTNFSLYAGGMTSATTGTPARYNGRTIQLSAEL